MKVKTYLEERYYTRLVEIEIPDDELEDDDILAAIQIWCGENINLTDDNQAFLENSCDIKEINGIALEDYLKAVEREKQINEILK